MNPFQPIRRGAAMLDQGATVSPQKYVSGKRGGEERSEATAGPTRKCICATRGTALGSGSSRFVENFEGTLALRSNENMPQSRTRA